MERRLARAARRRRPGGARRRIAGRRLGRQLGWIAWLALAAAPACAPAPAPLAGWNLVVINVDALRADRLGFHGYPRPTSPFLDRLARDGVVFERAIAHSSYTRESVAALLTGRLPSRSGSAGWHAAPRPGSPHLGERLRKAGYRTGFFSNSVMLRDAAFSRGFEAVQHLPSRWDLSGEGPRLSERALRFVREQDGARFALYLHYLDPHGPYDPPPELLRRVAPEAAAFPRLELYRDVAPHLASLVASGFGPGDARFEGLARRYDAEVAASDAAIEALAAGLARLGVLDHTLVVVTADHGEEFLEHGGVEHGWTLHEESLHVPLLFWAPAELAPARVAERVGQVDVLPTPAALLGLDGGGEPLDGIALFRAAAGALEPHAEARPLVAELLIARRKVMRAIIRDEWKYVAAHRWLEPEARAAADSVGAGRVDLATPPLRESLYHLREDPGEARDRLAEEPERARALREALDAALGPARVLEAPTAPPVSPEEQERLRALGYL